MRAINHPSLSAAPFATIGRFAAVSIAVFLAAANAAAEGVYPRETDPESPRRSQLDPAKQDEIIRIDVTGDGKPDILERWWAGKRMRWFDEAGTMTGSCTWGDMINGALQIDEDGDGYFDGPADLTIKWADTTGDGIPDIELLNQNPPPGARSVFARGPTYFVLIDHDSSGVLADLDWTDLSLSFTRWDKPGNWRTNYAGNSTFLKEATPAWAHENIEYTWENPFHFWDTTGDGTPNVSLRVADDRVLTGPNRSQVRHDGLINEAWVSYDIHNDAGHRNEFRYDLTLYVAGEPGVRYDDEIHEFPQIKAPDWAEPYYRHFEWRQNTRFRFLGRDDAIAKIFGGQWARAFMTFDEDQDNFRWERVEIYYPGDPYILEGRHPNSPIYHPQADTLGDRAEWDEDFSGEGKLYRAAWDGKIHLLGAERGVWLVDREAKYHGAVHPTGRSSPKRATRPEEVIQYFDKNGDGYIDTIVYDYDGNGTPNRVDDLNELGIDTSGPILDVTTMDWEMLREENANAVNRSWREAQRFFRVALAHQLADEEIIRFARGTSVAEKYVHAYWLKELFVRKVLAETPEPAHPAVLQAYYQRDAAAMDALLRETRRTRTQQ